MKKITEVSWEAFLKSVNLSESMMPQHQIKMMKEAFMGGFGGHMLYAIEASELSEDEAVKTMEIVRQEIREFWERKDGPYYEGIQQRKNHRSWFVAAAKVEMEHLPGATTSKHIATSIMLDVAPWLQYDQYLKPNGAIQKEGYHAALIAFAEGIVGTILTGEKENGWNKAEKLKYAFDLIAKHIEHEPEIIEANWNEETPTTDANPETGA